MTTDEIVTAAIEAMRNALAIVTTGEEVPDEEQREAA